MRNFFYIILSSLNIPVKFIYRNRLRVLAYHDVLDSGLFEKHINFLKKNYNLLSVEDLEKILFDNAPLPKYSILITFDDGDKSVLEKGLPVLEKYNCPACLFIITDLINSRKDFWWNTVYKNGFINKKSPLDIKKELNNLKKIPNNQRVLEVEKLNPKFKEQLSTTDLELLKDKGVFIGNHSHTHPMFDMCSEKEIIQELKNVEICFNKWGLVGFKVFAYPNGNFDSNTEMILKDNKIKLAFLFDHKINSRVINPFRISRIRVNSDTNLKEFKTKVSGTHTLFFKLF